MMEPSTITVSASDFPLPNTTDSRLLKEDGTYRWPYGLLNHRAWEFAPGLFLDDVAPGEGSRFGTAAAVRIVPLTPEEEARVLAHPFHEIALLRSVNSDRKLYGENAPRRRGAPVPDEGVRRGIMHMRKEPAFVYWFRLVSGENKIAGHKIGWAFDWRRRLQQFNSVSLSALGGLHYKPERVQRFDTARIAFRVEQKMLAALDGQRHRDNREVIMGVSPTAIGAIWDDLVPSAMLGKP